MSAVSGSRVPTDGLVMCLDASNPKTTNRTKKSSNLLQDYTLWATGDGSSTGYGSNGSTTEQLRAVITDDPWGGRSIVWRTVPDSTSGADGGWNSSYYSIDRQYTYRWSVWVRRHTAGTGGTFYMGLNPAPIRNDNSAVQSNPYFTYPSQSSLTLNQWYLVVGHCFYENYNGAVYGRHPDSGWYENGQKITDKSYGNVGTKDVRWNSTTTTAMHRTYHYYTTNTASGLEFAAPRLDKCDGTEPSIQELIRVGDSLWYDTSGNGNHGVIQNQSNVTWSPDFGGVFNFDGTSNQSYITCTGPNLTSSNFTVITASRYTTVSGRVVSGQANNWLLGHHSSTTGDYYANGWIRNNGTGDTNWGIYVGTGNIASDQYSFWVNGEKIVTNSTGGSQGPNGFGLGRYAPGNSEYSQAQIAYLAAYNRVLSDSEIINATNALRGRFGI